MSRVLVINPGSTSTKLALFKDGNAVFDDELQHGREDLAQYESVIDQMVYRRKCIKAVLLKENVELNQIDVVMGRGGLLKPISGGVYKIDDRMISDLASASYGEHPCNLGAPLAREIAREAGVPCFIADPVVTDEMMDVARLTGLPSIERRSVFHALSQRGAARKAAEQLGIEYEQSHFLVLHLGGGISIGAHRKGRVVDVINALDGEGPFSPERSGSLPALSVVDLLEKGRTPDEVRRSIVKEGGLWAHLGTNDMRVAQEKVENGEKKAELVTSSMAYNIARHACSLLPVFALTDGTGGACAVDAVVMTGGLARSNELTARLRALLGWLGPVVTLPGSVEMEALAKWGELALSQPEKVKRYP